MSVRRLRASGCRPRADAANAVPVLKRALSALILFSSANRWWSGDAPGPLGMGRVRDRGERPLNDSVSNRVAPPSLVPELST